MLFDIWAVPIVCWPVDWGLCFSWCFYVVLEIFFFLGREWFWKFVVLFGVDTHVVVDALWYVIVHDDRQLLSFSETRVSFDHSFFLGRYCLL